MIKTCVNKRQETLLKAAGLFPHEWMVIHEDDKYLHIINQENEIRIIDKKTKVVIGNGN